MTDSSRNGLDWHRELATKAALVWAQAHCAQADGTPWQFGQDVADVYMGVFAGLYQDGVNAAPASTRQGAVVATAVAAPAPGEAPPASEPVCGPTPHREDEPTGTGSAGVERG